MDGRMKMVLVLGTTTLACALGPALSAAPPTGKHLSPVRAAAVNRALAEELSTQHGVGLAVGIIEQGSVVYLNGLGFADREQKRPVTPETIMNWASNSKPLAAVAALQLVEQGKLDLDADVRKYVPEFPEKGSVITSRQLLCHQSGLPHYSNGKVIPTSRTYDVANPFLDPVHALDKFNQSPLLFGPGEQTDYSTYAYILLSAVIQRAGGEPFVDQIQSRIARPLGMSTLQVDLETVRPHWATGYSLTKGIATPVKDVSHGWKAGGGAFKSTIGDFAKFAEALINGTLMAPATQAKMWEPQKLKSGKPSEWSLGFTIGKDGSALKVSHNGKQEESTTRLVLYPAARSGIVVMSNCGFTDPGGFSTAVIRGLKVN